MGQPVEHRGAPDLALLAGLHQLAERVQQRSAEAHLPTLLLKPFEIPDIRATHVRLVMLNNQCTGQVAYQGEQDNDLLNSTDCNQTDRATIGHAAELQVFG